MVVSLAAVAAKAQPGDFRVDFEEVARATLDDGRLRIEYALSLRPTATNHARVVGSVTSTNPSYAIEPSSYAFERPRVGCATSAAERMVVVRPQVAGRNALRWSFAAEAVPAGDPDGDGADNAVDGFSSDPNVSADTDCDRIGDAYEALLGTDPDDAADRPLDANGDEIPDVLATVRVRPVSREIVGRTLIFTVGGVAQPGDYLLRNVRARLAGAPPTVAVEDAELSFGDVRPGCPAASADTARYRMTSRGRGRGGRLVWALAFELPPDGDGDGDGHSDRVDAFPELPVVHRDGDCDGIGDEYERQAGFDPTDAASTPPDENGNAIPDALEQGSLELAVAGAGTAADGRLTLLVAASAEVGISGTYRPPESRVRVTASDGVYEVETEASGGEFRITLPEAGAWTLRLDELEGAQRVLSRALDLAVDDEPPSLELVDALPDSVGTDMVRVTVEVTDEGTGVAHVRAALDRLRGVPFELALGADGVAFADLPLELGANPIVIEAEDRAGNAASVSAAVFREAGLAPSLAVTAPVSGTTVSTSTVDVAGEVFTSVAAELVRLELGGRQIFPSGDPPGYAFVFAGVPLEPGVNRLVLRAHTVGGVDERVVEVTYRPDEAGQGEPPAITVTAPIETTVARAKVQIAGEIASDSPPVTLQVNGDPVSSAVNPGGVGPFRYEATLADADGPQTFELVAVDAAGRETRETLVLVRDRASPTIEVRTPGFAESPAVLPVRELPYVLEGTVTDPNLAVLRLADAVLPAVPTEVSGQYRFRVELALAPGPAEPFRLSARDTAGNRTALEFILAIDVPVSLEVLTPAPDGEWLLDGSTAELEVLARALNVGDDATVTAALDGVAHPLAQRGEYWTGAVPLPAAEGDRDLLVVARDGAGNELLTRRVPLTFLDPVAVPLAIERSDPASGQEGVEPNTAVTLYFNRALDPDALDVRLLETAHGLTYDLSAQQGAQFASPALAELVEVDRNQAPVVVNPSPMPDGRTVAYYPERDLAYGGRAFVEVDYEGAPLARFFFDVRPLPTFVQGLVRDNYMQPIGGLEVSIPALGRTSVSDSYGNYGFGFGDRPDDPLPGGLHRIVFNPERTDPRFGTVEHLMKVVEGRFETLPMVAVPILNRTVHFQPTASGAPSVLLANGDLELDLADATLIFPDGRERGGIHVQFMPAYEAGVRTPPYATPVWYFAAQPQGIRVEGEPRLRMTLPSYYDAHTYLPPSGTLALLIGRDPETLLLRAVGVAELEGTTLVSRSLRDLRRLDYLTMSFYPEAVTELLEGYADGTLSRSVLEARLLAFLQALGQGGDGS